MSAAGQASTGRRSPRRVAIVIANPAVSTTTGWPVGFWWSELTHPWHVLSAAGYEIELFSPDGGACRGDALSDPRDPSGYSAHDFVSMGFIATPALARLVETTRPVRELDLERFDALLLAGGQSPMFSFERAHDLVRAFERFHAAGKIAAALCHGVAVLRYAKDPNGQPLVRGRTVTGFADVEEDAADESVWSMGALPRGVHVMPWRIEPTLRALGANFVRFGPWQPFAVRDGNLVTGQQNLSGARTAELVVEALGR